VCSRWRELVLHHCELEKREREKEGRERERERERQSLPGVFSLFKALQLFF